jgi:hypothetical protein
MTTTDEGTFDAPALVPGPGYDLKVTRNGFSSWEAKNIEVTLGKTLNFKISLQLQTPSTFVEAKTNLPLGEDTKFSVTTQITQQQFESLPSRNRLLDTLVLLAPGVTQNTGSGALAFRGEPFGTGLLTDGADTINTYYFQRSGIAQQTTTESTTEMQVLSAAAPAEFGHSMGGFVNAATRSGTSGLHGAGYDYFDPHSLDAADRYAPDFKPSGWRHQAGVSAGGPAPVAADKLFWYFNGDVVDAKSQGLNRLVNPLVTNTSGTAVAAENCGAPATAAQCAAATNFINSQLNRVVSRPLLSGSGLAKVDWRPTENNNFTFEANGTHRRSPDGVDTDLVSSNNGLLGNNGTYDEQTRFAKADWTVSLAGSAVNELRAAWFHDRFSAYEDPSLLPSTGALGITVAGTAIGGNPAYPEVVSEQRYQLVDNLTITSGTHSLKFGADYSRVEDWTYQVNSRAGTFDYSTLTAFAEDFSANTQQHKDYVTYTQGFGNPVIDLHSPVISAWAEDSWKVTPRLTVNLGVRFEKSLLPQPKLANTSYYLTGSISSPSNDFSPRIGAAYMLNSRTAVRLGFGSYYQPFSGQLLDTLFIGNGIYQENITVTPIQTGAPVFPKSFNSANNLPTGTSNIAYAVSKFRNPYTEQAALGIERSLAAGTDLTVSYILSRGNKLWTATDQNLAASTVTRTYTIDDANGSAVASFSTLIWNAKGDSSHARVYQIDSEGSSRYNALAVQLAKRTSHGFSFHGSYTWSHAFDDVSGPAAPGLGFIPLNTYPGNYRFDYGNSSFDQRHRGVLNWTWRPAISHADSPLRVLATGWQLSAIATLASPLPATPLVLVNGQQFTGLTMAYATSLNGSGGWSRVPFAQTNTLRMGREYDVDARIARSVPVTERVKAQLMFEAFNLFNTQYATGVNTIAYVATSGVLRPVSGEGMGISAGDYPYGTNARRAQFAIRVEF